jgi:hypothetical protein
LGILPKNSALEAKVNLRFLGAGGAGFTEGFFTSGLETEVCEGFGVGVGLGLILLQVQTDPKVLALD